MPHGQFEMIVIKITIGFPFSSVGKESACSAGDLGLIPGWDRSPGEGNGNPLQYSYLENPMDRGAWQATVHGVARVSHDIMTKPPPRSPLALCYLNPLGSFPLVRLLMHQTSVQTDFIIIIIIKIIVAILLST